ncbi:MAG: hypothetical protein K0R55_2048 [Sporomusa sp.]|jgi:hypothetical protein|nr:hypothetical protein [Sporomusa sp.]
MKDFCGKNGCYRIEKENDVEFLNVFLNSVKVYEEHNDKFIYVQVDKREIPDLVFELVEEEESDCLLTTGMDVQSFCADGVNEFVSSLLKSTDEIVYKEGLCEEVERLLNQEGAIWGIEPEIATQIQ